MSGPYRINIVHFVNPHLIWVESSNNADGKKENEENELEQIGLFGVLPLLPQIDIIQNEIVSYRVDDWAPAITELMKKILRDAREITFEPIFTDPNNAIFDSISHKFGEITIKKRNGFFKFSEELNKTNFSMGDRPEFLRKLEAGELRSKLSKWETNNIIKSITSSSKTRDSKNLVFLKKCRDDDEIADDDTLSSSDKFATELTIDNVHRHNCLIDKMESPKMVPSESASMQLEEKLQMWKLAETKDDLPSEYSVLVTEEKIEQDPLEKSKLYLLKKLHEYKEIKKNQQPNPQARQEKQKYEEPVKIPKFIPKYDLSVYTNRVYDLDSKLNRPRDGD